MIKYYYWVPFCPCFLIRTVELKITNPGPAPPTRTSSNTISFNKCRLDPEWTHLMFNVTIYQNFWLLIGSFWVKFQKHSKYYIIKKRRKKYFGQRKWIVKKTIELLKTERINIFLIFLYLSAPTSTFSIWADKFRRFNH